MTKVLVADDDPVSLLFFSETITAAGLTCTTSDNGSDAINFAQDTRFDLLLLDCRMPDLGALEILREIRSNTAHASHDSPALATSAEINVAQREKLDAAGFIDVLMKPCSSIELTRILQKTIQRSDHEEKIELHSVLLDQTAGLRSVGGDIQILLSLRKLLLKELQRIEHLIANASLNQNFDQLHEEMHRLSASAGFCGVPGLQAAIRHLQQSLRLPQKKNTALQFFLNRCSAVRQALQEEMPR